MGLSTRNVYYHIDKGLLKASHLSTRITLIKRKDIDVMLDDNHEKRKRKSNQPITEFYTTSEILQKYGISESGLYKIAKIRHYFMALNNAILVVFFAIDYTSSPRQTIYPKVFEFFG